MAYVYDAWCLVCVSSEQKYEQKYEPKELSELDTFTMIIHGLIKVQDSTATYKYN